MTINAIQWSPFDREPADSQRWEDIVAPIVAAGGWAVLVLHPDIGRWHVNEAYKRAKVESVGDGTINVKYQDVRAEVDAALRRADKPVV